MNWFCWFNVFRRGLRMIDGVWRLTWLGHQDPFDFKLDMHKQKSVWPAYILNRRAFQDIQWLSMRRDSFSKDSNLLHPHRPRLSPQPLSFQALTQNKSLSAPQLGSKAERCLTGPVVSVFVSLGDRSNKFQVGDGPSFFMFFSTSLSLRRAF